MNRRWILLIAILIALPLMIFLGFLFSRPTTNPPTTGPAAPGGVITLYAPLRAWTP
jgi:hypothetical protein